MKLRREGRGRGFERIGSMIIGGRVDEIATERDASGDAGNASGIDAFGRAKF